MRVLIVLGVSCAVCCLHGAGPVYTPSSIVSAATNQPGPLAPNTIVALYGSELAYVTRALTASDIRNNSMPTLLPGTGVRVLVGNISAQIYFVSPRQVNLLLPPTLLPGPADLQLSLDGRAGPTIRLQLERAAPALFLQSEATAIAVRPDGSVATSQSPAQPGETVVLYATGLGATTPPARYGEIARTAAPLAATEDFEVTLNANPVPASHVLYTGLAPGFAGLYQINLTLPADTPSNPDIRLRSAGVTSPIAIRLPVAGR